MSFDPGIMFASLVVSGVGFILLSYGRSAGRFPHLVAGGVLLIYPYFVTSLAFMLLVAAGLFAATWLAVRLGY